MVQPHMRSLPIDHTRWALTLITVVACTGSPQARANRGILGSLDSLPTAPVSLVDTVELAVSLAHELGASAGTPLHVVRAARFLEDGRLAVANEGGKSVMLFGTDGDLSRQLGGPGEGPGEFGLVRTVSETSDGRLRVWDPGLSRVTTFDLRGEAPPLTIRVVTPRAAFRPDWVESMSADRLVMIHTMRIGGRRPIGFSVDSAHVTITHSVGAELYTVGTFPGTQWFRATEGGSIVAPMGQRDLYLGATGSALYLGDGLRPEVVEFDLRGSATRGLVLPTEREALTAESRAYDRARFLAQLSEELQTQVAPIYDEGLSSADSLLVYTELQAASDGGLWIKLYGYGTDQATWLVVDPTRLAAQRLTLPRDALVLDAAGDRLAVLLRDELERQLIHVYRIL